MTEEIGDDHASAGERVHVPHDGDGLRFVEVVQEHGGEDVIKTGGGEWEIKDIGLYDLKARIAFACRGCVGGYGVTIYADDSDIKAIAVGPFQDGAGDIGRAGGQIENFDSLPLLPCAAETLEVAEGGSGVAKPRIDPSNKAQAAAKLIFICAGLVHPLALALAIFEVFEHL